jgi:hypothetical protein
VAGAGELSGFGVQQVGRVTAQLSARAPPEVVAMHGSRAGRVVPWRRLPHDLSGAGPLGRALHGAVAVSSAARPQSSFIRHPRVRALPGHGLTRHCS